jgi:hypothetical protein
MREKQEELTCPLCGHVTRDYYSTGAIVADTSAPGGKAQNATMASPDHGRHTMVVSDIKCSNKQCFFSSNYVPRSVWMGIHEVKRKANEYRQKVIELEAEAKKANEDLEIVDRALGMVCGALWLHDNQGSGWTYIYDKYIKYATAEVAREEK